MKVCLIIHSLGIGGMERVMALLIQNFSEFDNVELHLILIGRKREVIYSLPENVNIHKPAWKFDNSKRTYHTLKTLGFIRSRLKTINPDTVLSFGELWNNLVLLASFGLNYSVFVADRSKPDKNLGKLQNFLRDKMYPRAAGFIAQTVKAEKAARRKNWNENIKIIGNPVPKFTVQAESSRINTVLTIGRLIATKNVDRLIEMFTEVNRDRQWELIVVGGNAKRMYLLEEYKAKVEKKGLTDQINLVGEKKDVVPYYEQASVFAFTSTSEGFPNALAEAMAAGCACISYDCIAGPSDIIDDGKNGFLIPVGDEKIYKEKLELLMKAPDLRERFGKAAKEKMKEFEAGGIAKRFYEFITEDRR